MQDSNPQADGNAEARSRDEWRSDRSADTVLRDGGADTDSGGRRRGSERVGRGGGGGGGGVGGGGVWEKNFLKAPPQLAQPPTPKDAPPDQTNECAEPGVTPSRCETGQNWPIGSSAPKLTQGATPARLENTKTYPAKHPADRPWDTSGIPLPSPASFRVRLALLDAETDTRLSMRTSPLAPGVICR